MVGRHSIGGLRPLCDRLWLWVIVICEYHWLNHAGLVIMRVVKHMSKIVRTWYLHWIVWLFLHVSSFSSSSSDFVIGDAAGICFNLGRWVSVLHHIQCGVLAILACILHHCEFVVTEFCWSQSHHQWVIDWLIDCWLIVKAQCIIIWKLIHFPHNWNFLLSRVM